MMEGGRRVNKDTIRGATNTQWIYTTGEGHMCSDSIYESNLRLIEDLGIDLGSYPDVIPFDKEVHPRGTNTTCITKEKYPYGRVQSTKDFILKSMWVHGIGRYEYDSSWFHSKNTPTTIVCPIHGEFQQTPSVHMSGSSCKRCNTIKTLDQWIAGFHDVYGEGTYDYSNAHNNFIDGNHKIEIRCPSHNHTFFLEPSVHVTGTKCPKCSNRYRRTREDWIEQLSVIFKAQPWIDFSSSEFGNMNTPVEIYCKKHDETHNRNPQSLLEGHGCPTCMEEGKLSTNRSNRLTTAHEYLDVESFDYDLDSLTDIHDKIWITCRKHKVSFKNSIVTHSSLIAKGCPVCASNKVTERLSMTTEEFITASKALFGEHAFDYTDTDYIKSSLPVKLKCNTCGWKFEKKPNSHFTKKAGCPRCSGKIRWNTATWVKYAKEARGHEGFDYSMVDYKGAFTPVTIRCRNGHEFSQTPDNHMNGGKGCNYCKTPNMYYGESGYYDESTMGFIYVMRFTCDEEEFGKIGISKNPSKRFTSSSYNGFTIVEEYLSECMNMLDALSIEQTVLSRLRADNKAYSPIGGFDGKTECFGSEHIDSVITLIGEMGEDVRL